MAKSHRSSAEDASRRQLRIPAVRRQGERLITLRLAGRGLLLERLLGLVEQAHVLDRDRGLVGERLEQRDCLSLNGRTSLAARMIPERAPSRSSGTPRMVRKPMRQLAAEGIRFQPPACRLCAPDRSVHDLPADGAPVERQWAPAGSRPDACDDAQCSPPPDQRTPRLRGQMRRVGGDRQAPADVGRRADYPQDVADCHLLLERLLVSLNSRAFSIAIAAWSAKVSSSATCFSRNGRVPAPHGR